MRHRSLSLLLLGVLGAVLAGCTFTRGEEPIVVTATLSVPLTLPATVTPESATLAAVVSTDVPTPAPTATDEEPSPSPAPPTETPALTSSDTPTPAPTRTVLRPPTVLPLDDGSGRLVPDTGTNQTVFRPIPDLEALPETLYFLSEQAGMAQVWRLPYGLGYPEQLSLSFTAVTAFDVAPDGKLAYLTADGGMVIDGLPFLPPNTADGRLPHVTALAWSPAGDWLAYVLSTPAVDGSRAAGQDVDGVWIRNVAGQAVRLGASSYDPGEGYRHFTGPIEWRPGGAEFLVRLDLEAGSAYGRVDIESGALTPGWDESALAPGTFETAHWSVNGNAIITSGAREALRIEPGTLGAQPLVAEDSDLWIEDARQFANGTLTFLGSATGDSGPAGPRRLYLLPPGADRPQAVSGALSAEGAVGFLWDNFGEQVLIVTYDAPGDLMGTATLLGPDGTQHDLSPLTGPVGAPKWGPHVKPGDSARVQATQGESLNVRAQPGGQILVQLANGARVTILGGPRQYEGMRWWQVRTPDGIAGWTAESVTNASGRRQWTLLPSG